MTNSEPIIYSIEHYNISSGSNKIISNARLLREKWIYQEYKKYIEKLSDSEKDELKERINQGSRIDIIDPIIRIICGDFALTDTPLTALQLGFTVKILCGDCLFDEKIKENICSLKTDYPNKFFVYAYNENEDENYRLENHSACIGNNLFYENHAIFDPYNWDKRTYNNALIIENASLDMLQDYEEIFESYVNSSEEKKESDEIRNMPTLKKGRAFPGK